METMDEELESIIKVEPEVFGCITRIEDIKEIGKNINEGSLDDDRKSQKDVETPKHLMIIKNNQTVALEVNDDDQLMTGKPNASEEIIDKNAKSDTDDEKEVEILFPNPFDQEENNDLTGDDVADEVDWNLMNSIRIVHEYLSLNEPVHGLTEDEWLNKIKENCKFNRKQLSPKVFRLSWQEIMRLTAEQLPATRQKFPYKWHGDHLFTERKEFRILTIDSTDRVPVAEFFFVTCLRGKELQNKDKVEYLWPRCGDLRCASPKHMLIIRPADLESRIKCFASKDTICDHDPTCIRENPLPPLDNKELIYMEAKAKKCLKSKKRKCRIINW